MKSFILFLIALSSSAFAVSEDLPCPANKVLNQTETACVDSCRVDQNEFVVDGRCKHVCPDKKIMESMGGGLICSDGRPGMSQEAYLKYKAKVKVVRKQK